MKAGASELAAVLDGIAAWVHEEVSPKLAYMVPPADGAVNSEVVEWANPSVFQMFVPSVERLEPGMVQVPNIAVQFLGGDDALGSLRTFDVRLVLTVWAPGNFDDGAFERNQDGWRDLMNGLGVIATAVREAETLSGCAVDMGTGIKYGLFDENGQIPDLYPFWMGKVDFRLRRAPHASNKFENLL